MILDPKKVASTAENGRGEIGWGPFPLLLATVVYPEISPIFPAQSFRGARGDGEVFYAFSEKTGRKREKEGRMTTSESWLFALMGFWSKREGKRERVGFWKKRVSPFSISPFFRGKERGKLRFVLLAQFQLLCHCPGVVVFLCATILVRPPSADK